MQAHQRGLTEESDTALAWDCMVNFRRASSETRIPVAYVGAATLDIGSIKEHVQILAVDGTVAVEQLPETGP
jgi:hypothetical protein